MLGNCARKHGEAEEIPILLSEHENAQVEANQIVEHRAKPLQQLRAIILIYHNHY